MQNTLRRPLRRIQPPAAAPLDGPRAEDTLLDLYWNLAPARRAARFVTTTAAAVRVGRTPRTIQTWIESGRIGAVRIGKKYAVDVESLYEYLRRESQADR